MKTILIITLFSWIIYKAGCVKWLLNAAVIQEPEPVKRSYKKPLKQIKNQEPPQISEREQLEIQAAAVVAAMEGDPRTVKYMNESLLRALIIDYTNEHLKR